MQTITRRFFQTATEQIECAVADEPDPRRRIRTYLTGVGTAMRVQSPEFNADMVNPSPRPGSTARTATPPPAGSGR